MRLLILMRGTYDRTCEASRRQRRKRTKRPMTITISETDQPDFRLARVASFDPPKQALVIGRVEYRRDGPPELPGAGSSREIVEGRLADPRSNESELVRTIDLLQYLDTQIPVTPTYCSGNPMQRSLDLPETR